MESKHAKDVADRFDLVKEPAGVGHRFDDLAKLLANSATRRRVLKLLASSVFAGSIAPLQSRAIAAASACSSTTLKACVDTAKLERDAELKGCDKQSNEPSPSWGGAVTSGCKIAVYRKYHNALERCERAQCKKGQCLNDTCCEGGNCCPAGERQCGSDSAFDYTVAYCCPVDQLCCGADCCPQDAACCPEIDFGFPGFRNPSRKDVCADLASNPKHCGGCGNECDDCEVCRDGACVSTCNADKCDRCVDGACVPVCGACETCVQGGPWPICEHVDCGSPCLHCVDEACVPVDCGMCHTCDPEQGCTAIDCGSPCLECVGDACVPTTCPPCTECDPAAGGCTPIDCGDLCSECVNDSCQPKVCDDRCQECANGACVTKNCAACESCDSDSGACVSNCDQGQVCCDGKCADTTCSDSEIFDPETCSCECAVTCAGGQPPDPTTCLCGCPPVSCPAGQTQNPESCACECSGFQTGCAPHEICDNGQCIQKCLSTANGGVHNGTFVACPNESGNFGACFCNTCGTTCRHSNGYACCSDGCQYVVTTCADMGH